MENRMSIAMKFQLLLLGATTAQQLDDKVEKFYAESPRNIASANAAISRIARNGLGIAHGANTAFYPTLSTAKPLDANPGGSNCQFVPTDYEEVYANECYDDGGDYNFGTCECNGGSGDGDGGGTDPLPGDYTPIIAGIAPSSWTAGTTTQVTFSGQYFGTNAPTLSFSPGSGIVYTLLSYSDTQIVASIKIASGTPDESVGVSVTNNGYGGNAFSNLNGPESPTSFPVTATVLATCFAQLKYRAVPNIPVTANHSFWYIQDSTGSQEIIDGGPQYDTCSLTSPCGYLIDWVTEGTVGHYAADNAGASTSFNSGSSPALCSQVDALEEYAIHWPQSEYYYVVGDAPNSNTFAHDCATAGGFDPPEPPRAVGW